MHITKTINTTFRGYPSITADVQQYASKSGIQNGLCTVTVPHHSAALAITSFWDTRGLDDLMDEVDRNLPTRTSYKRPVSPYDASGNIKTSWIGNTISLTLQNGKLILGSSQGLVLLEFDGPCQREYTIQIIPCTVQTKVMSVQTQYMGMHSILYDVQQAISEQELEAGLCHLSVLHSTAGLLLCSHNTQVQKLIMADIERLVPTRVDFKHRETASDAGGHVKTALFGTQLSLPVQAGNLRLGKYHDIVFAEFDGPRPRSYTLSLFPDL